MVIDLEIFRLADGVDEDTFLAVDRAMQQEFVPNLDGFVRRTTALADDGRWLVVTLWFSAEQAVAPPDEFTALIADVERSRFTTLD